jgi:hypothetical protein
MADATAVPFLDTNILLRMLTGENLEQSPHATRLLTQIEALSNLHLSIRSNDPRISSAS